jgi:hypothetical protein
MLIDYYGGARSVGGNARNMINGVSDFNPNRPFIWTLHVGFLGHFRIIHRPELGSVV